MLIPLGWLSASAGGAAAGAFEQISTTVLGASAASVTFSSIPSTYKHLQIRIAARTDRALQLDGVNVRLNNDTGANYASHNILGDGSTVAASASTGLTSMAGLAVAAGNTAASGIFSANMIDLLDYANTTTNKTARFFAGLHSSTYNYVRAASGLWLSTAAISTVTLLPQTGPNFISGSRFTLYGIKG